MADQIKTARYYLKHRAEPACYAVEADEDGFVLKALDVTDENSKGGLCKHMIGSLPLAGDADDLLYIQRDREQFEPYEPPCGNVHHLMQDLLALEADYATSAGAFAIADGKAKMLKKDMEAKGAAVHALLGKIQVPKVLPLFDGIGR